MPLRLRTVVGVVPLFACEVIEQEVIDRLPGFSKRMRWFLKHQGYLARHISSQKHSANDGKKSERLLLAIPPRERLQRVLQYVLDENELLSPHGVRSLSRIYKDNPYVFHCNGQEFCAQYEPAESRTNMFGGNSNWRGPVWFPLNYLLAEALQRYHYFYGDSLKVEFPTRSGNWMNLKQVALQLHRRLSELFLPDASGRRPCHGDDRRYAEDPAWRDRVLFYEYFDGDNGRGCGASHQTGWTSLVAKSLEEIATNHSRQLREALIPQTAAPPAGAPSSSALPVPSR
jgi:mannosylglycerate hydrolase MGH1-like protein